MTELIKYAKTDILDGLKSIKIGLSNIIFKVANSGEDYTIALPLDLHTLKTLIELTIIDCWQVPRLDIEYRDHSFLLYCKEFQISVSKDNSEFRFKLVK